MAGIGKAKPKAKDTEGTLEQVKKEFAELYEKIKARLGDRKDKNQLERDEKMALRTDYFRAAQLAKKVADRSTDVEEAERYKEFHKKLSERAEALGSAIKRAIPETTLEDVKGLKDVKALVKTFLFMAKNPQILEAYNMKGGLGLLMYGAPGTGKTMIAEAIANEMQVPLFVLTPADIFKSYVGESEQAVKQLFQEIEACEDGAILFVDECESIFSKRTSDAKDYKAAVTTELLQRINGFGVDGSKRILIGATNRPDMIDPAYLRYKRFSHLIHITPPDVDAKREIIAGKLKGIELDGISSEDILMMTLRGQIGSASLEEGGICSAYYSSADICGIIEEACRIAIERLIETGSTKPIPLTREMFEQAFEKIPPSISGAVYAQYDNFRKNINL